MGMHVRNFKKIYIFEKKYYLIFIIFNILITTCENLKFNSI